MSEASHHLVIAIVIKPPLDSRAGVSCLHGLAEIRVDADQPLVEIGSTLPRELGMGSPRLGPMRSVSAAMSGSSLLVMLNALRARQQREAI